MNVCTAFDCEHVGPPKDFDSPRVHCNDKDCENRRERCPVHRKKKK